MEQHDRTGGPSIVSQELYGCAVVCVVGEVEADFVGGLGWNGHGVMLDRVTDAQVSILREEEENRGSLPRTQLVLLALREGAGRVSEQATLTTVCNCCAPNAGPR